MLKVVKIKDTNYVVYKALKGFEMTNEDNYNAYMMNANQITKFHTFGSLESVLDYIQKYFKGVVIE